MASKFYGQVKGSGCTNATRTGSAKSGLRASAQSWHGSVIVEVGMYPDGNGGETEKFILSVAKGSDFIGRQVFFGTIDELAMKLAGKTVDELCEGMW